MVCFLSVEWPRFALGAGVGEVFSKGIFDCVWVKALNVLPGIASIAVDRVPVIVREAAYALYCVRFFFHSLLLRGALCRGGGGSRESCLTRSHDLR
jgi:hypothetical protein